ncbi:MAG: tetratricopeptide repeat protein [Rhodocyclaceae bacterium]|nr:MAG: tetratricopeptide repeat protein [Rhodocyclaceae bacterium]
MDDSPTRLLELAISRHGEGKLAEAETLYLRLLDTQGDHVEGLHFLGILRHQMSRSEEGIALMVQALTLDANSAGRFNDLGNVLHQCGDAANAAEAFQNATLLDPRDATLWNNLGSALQQLGKHNEAEQAFRQAIALNPDLAEALNNLAGLLAARGDEEAAAEQYCRAYILPPLEGKPPRMLAIAYYRLERYAEAADCYRAWLKEEPGNAQAAHMLAACSGEAVPARADDAFVVATFDDMAAEFEYKLVHRLGYRGPELVAELLAFAAPAPASLDILDCGCGTGLCAPVLHPYARHLAGVDLSTRMLAKAAARQIYDMLTEDELTAYLHRHPQQFDLLVAADTLIYFGDLAPVFIAMRQGLRPGGKLIFTVETATGSGYDLHPSGRYRHDPEYLLSTLAQAGFTPMTVREAVLRREFGQPTLGLAVLAA